MRTLWQDIRYGVRMLAKSPAFTAVAVLSLALGIGANTALFSVVDAVLLKKLPVKEPDRLVLFRWVSGPNFSPGAHNGNVSRDESGRLVKSSFPYQTYARLREQLGPLSDVFAFGSVTLDVSADGRAEVAAGQAVSGNYYAALGVPALVGRTITDEDDRAASPPVAVLSYRYWQRRFGGDRSVVGRQIDLNNVAFTVVGVTPRGFDGTMEVGNSPDVSIPIAWEPQVDAEHPRMKGAGVWWLRLMGRLKDGATPEQARASLETIFQQSALEHREARVAGGETTLKPLVPEDYPHLVAYPGDQGETATRRYYRKPLYMLLGVVGLVLLIACANVANLQLARAASRQKEIAVRLALGAGRWRLIRQLLTESLLLASLGGALGVLLAFWIKDGLLAVGDWAGGDMVALEPRLDLRVLSFTLALALLTGLLFGMVPALRATRVDLTPALKDGVRTSSAASRSLFTKALVAAQVAMSLLLLVGAGLFVRTLVNLERVELGFNERNLLLFTVEPGLIGYKGDRLVNLYKQMAERVEGVPGVEAVTFSGEPLLAFSESDRSVFLPNSPVSADGEVKPSGNLYINQVRENFPKAMGIPLLSGRDLTPHDDERAPKVAVVNQTFARRFFNGENPVGKRFRFDPKGDDVEIVGLVGDAKYESQRTEAPPTAYLPWSQELPSIRSVTFEVRTSGDPTTYVAAVRSAAGDVDSNLPLKDIKTQVEQADETLSMERLFAKLLSLFGLLAQVLAAVGLYGVLAWSVAQRTREIGIRVALGAQSGDVLRMVLRQGMALTLLGVALGLAGAYALTKYLASLSQMLYGVSATDPLTFGVIASLLTLVALAACYVPARRATKVDPMEALRYE